MTNLKYKEIDWTNDKRLMFVTFTKDNKEYKWFPKWEELADIISCSFCTEGTLNNGRLKDYLTFICLEPIFRQLSLLKCNPDNSYSHEILARQFNDVIETISMNLLNKDL
jgi:hypothetical protein